MFCDIWDNILLTKLFFTLYISVYVQVFLSHVIKHIIVHTIEQHIGEGVVVLEEGLPEVSFLDLCLLFGLGIAGFWGVENEVSKDVRNSLGIMLIVIIIIFVLLLCLNCW